MGGFLAENRDLSGIAAPITLQHLHRGGLPRSVRTEKGEDLTSHHGQIDAAHHLVPAVALPQS
jgi:hypothetical protein